MCICVWGWPLKAKWESNVAYFYVTHVQSKSKCLSKMTKEKSAMHVSYARGCYSLVISFVFCLPAMDPPPPQSSSSNTQPRALKAGAPGHIPRRAPPFPQFTHRHTLRQSLPLAPSSLKTYTRAGREGHRRGVSMPACGGRGKGRGRNARGPTRFGPRPPSSVFYPPKHQRNM